MPPRGRPLLAAILSALAVTGGAAPGAVSLPAALAGTYRLAGAAHLEVAPFPARDEDLHADAVLSPGPHPGEVRLELAVDTFRCALRGSVDAAGGLALQAGQRCPVSLADLGEGQAEATLRAGSGAVREGALSLRLAFALSGRVRLRGGGALDALGEALALPGAGGRFTEVTGEVRGQADGRLDASRAAQGDPPPPGRTP